MRSYLFKVLFLLASCPLAAQDMTAGLSLIADADIYDRGGATDVMDSVSDGGGSDMVGYYYDEPVNGLAGEEGNARRFKSFWQALIPRQAIVQYAGNMGMFSAGIGWDYGRHRKFETNLLFGFVPKYNSDHAKMTMTLKQNFIFWHVPFNVDSETFVFDPLSCGIYINAIFGDEFWMSQPDRYPNGYYEWLSTRYRINVFVGERITWRLPNAKNKFVKSVTAFYEASVCDIYLRSMIQSSKVDLWDIICLSVGIKLQFVE